MSCGTDEWMVGVLRHGYRLPFHHLPRVSLVPVELSSVAPGSVRALALQEEVSKMLMKGAVEMVPQPGPGFYSCLFLMLKVTGGWRPVIDLSSLNDFVTVTKFKIAMVSSVLASVRRGDWMFSGTCRTPISRSLYTLILDHISVFASRVVSTSSRL